MTRVYCRMRGKDFVRKYMQHGFKNKNLGKGICPTLAIISSPEVKRAMVAASNNNNNTVVLASDDVDGEELEDNKMHTMMEYTCAKLLNDDFICKDEENLFQEELLL